jgi:hypothetical protein
LNQEVPDSWPTHSRTLCLSVNKCIIHCEYIIGKVACVRPTSERLCALDLDKTAPCSRFAVATWVTSCKANIYSTFILKSIYRIKNCNWFALSKSLQRMRKDIEENIPWQATFAKAATKCVLLAPSLSSSSTLKIRDATSLGNVGFLRDNSELQPTRSYLS